MAGDTQEKKFKRTKFRNSMTSPEGHVPARVVQGTVIAANLTKWTVDVLAQYDRKRYFSIQVGSPYLHHSNGEGIYIVPEVGATVMVCLPSDTSAPFVLAYVMPTETVNDSSADAPQGTSSHGQQPPNATDSSYGGGRPQAKPGDIVMRTRDGNFVVLHRGGVLQIGATPLSQRIFIPLGNIITDISENYEHHNSMGSMIWGIQEGPSQVQVPGQFTQTYRVFASDQYADIRVCAGYVANPVPEPDGGVTMAEAQITDGDDGQGANPIIYEVTVSPKGFVAQSGFVASDATGADSVMKFVFDRKGNTLLRTQGNLIVQVEGKLTFKVAQPIAFEFDQTAAMSAKNGMDINGGPYAHVKGDIVRLGAGAQPIARLGDMVTMQPGAAFVLQVVGPVTVTIPGVGTVPCQFTTPVAGTLAAPCSGAIMTGNQAVLG